MIFSPLLQFGLILIRTLSAACDGPALSLFRQLIIFRLWCPKFFFPGDDNIKKYQLMVIPPLQLITMTAIFRWLKYNRNFLSQLLTLPPPPSLICQIFTFAEPPLPSLSISLNMATSSLNGPVICSTVWFQIPHDIHYMKGFSEMT